MTANPSSILQVNKLNNISIMRESPFSVVNFITLSPQKCYEMKQDIT